MAKMCKKCSSTDRYKDGDCSLCSIARSLAAARAEHEELLERALDGTLNKTQEARLKALQAALVYVAELRRSLQEQ